MTEKEWLQRAWNVEKEIRELEDRRDGVQADALRITPSYEYRGNQTFPSGNGNESKYIKLAEFNQRIDARIDELYRIKMEINDAIDKISDAKLSRLLKLRYIDLKTWEEVAERLDFNDVRWVYVLHGRALKKIGEVLNLSG